MTAPKSNKKPHDLASEPTRFGSRMNVGKHLRRWAPPVVLGLISLVTWQVAYDLDSDEASVERVDHGAVLATPMLSARRIPQTLQAPVVDDGLIPAISKAATDLPETSCLAVENSGRLLSPDKNIDTPFLPASNQKVLTTFSALEMLGPDFQYETVVRADGSPAAGVVEGNLYLVGSGDPYLSTADWWTQYDDLDGRFNTSLGELADRVVESGITTVNGGIIGDESRYDAVRSGPWPQRHLNSQQSGPLSALVVNEGFTAWPPEHPGSARNRIQADNPPLHAAEVFSSLLIERGITIVGAPDAGAAPASAGDITSILSPPLQEIITHINSYSSNLGAELVLKELGKSFEGEGSTVVGAQVVRAALEAAGVSTNGLVIEDGSGLGDNNRLTCRTLLDVLHVAGPHSSLSDSMAIGSVRGSLKNHFIGTPAEGVVQAKTGTLDDALALSGYVSSTTDSDVVLTFSYVANEELIISRSDVIRALAEELLVALASYPGLPSVDSLSPLAPSG